MRRLETVEAMAAMAKQLRRHIVNMTTDAGSGHPGGSLSAVEIAATLYFQVLRYDPTRPHWPDRDRFILSKGHAAPLLYAVLAEAGFFPVSDLATLRRLGSRLQGHTDMNATPGVEMSSGSLGQGLSFSVGVAIAGLLDDRDYNVYTLLGDGECDEGQVWEAAMAAGHFKVKERGLDNLCAVVDCNRQQINGWTKDVMSLDPLAEKWRFFGWHDIQVDGHDLLQVKDAFAQAQQVRGRPTVIIAHTTKGKGVSFMENNPNFHGRAATPEQRDQALAELE